MTYQPADGIKDFPYDNPNAKIVKRGKTPHLTVVERHQSFDVNGKYRDSQLSIGKIVDNRFYSMEEYQQLFKRNGEARGIPAQRAVRTYVRKHAYDAAKYAKPFNPDYPKPEDIANYPFDIPKAKVIKVNTTFYVAITNNYFDNGKRKCERKLLGRIVDNRFYTIEEYRVKFNRKGQPR